jgi:hypothetical protein
MGRWYYLLLFFAAAPQPALGQVERQQKSFFLAHPRAVGIEVPESLLKDLQIKIKALISRRNHLLVEGEEDRSLVRGPALDVAALGERLERARKAFDELDLASARDAVAGVSRAVGGLPITSDGRALWLRTQSLTVELADAEQQEFDRDRALAELLRLAPDFDPKRSGFAPHLVERTTLAKASIDRGVPLRLVVRPPAAKVWIDGVLVRSGDLVRPGPHRVLVRAPGHAAFVGVISVLGGRQEVVIDRRLNPARFRQLLELDEALSARESEQVLLRHVGDAARAVGADLGFLVTVGKREDQRYNVVLAATHPNGQAAGVGRLVSSGLTDQRALVGMIAQASREGAGSAIAGGKWAEALATAKAALQPEPEPVAEPEVRSEPARRSLRSMGMLPASRLRKSPLRSRNFWLLTGVVVVGATAAVLIYQTQDAPKEFIDGDPTMVVDVSLP